MVESRVAGRYGTHGWTEREGVGKPRPRPARKGGSPPPSGSAEDDRAVD